MLGFAIGIFVTVVAAWLIVKNYQPQTILLLAGLALLVMTVFLFPEQEILYSEKSTSVGSKVLDIFVFVKSSLTTQIAGIGLIIMAAGGFADYMDHVKASNAMVRLCIKPLSLIKAPYIILALGYLLGQSLHVAISSAAGLAMLLLVTFFPVLVRLGVSKAAAAAMIGMTAFMDLGPAVGTANQAAQEAGIETAVYFVHYQLPVAVGVMLVVAVLIAVTARYFDAKDQHIAVQQDIVETQQDDKVAPSFYAILPLIPIVLVIVFSPLVIKNVKVDVVTAMIIGALITFVIELIVKRNFKEVCKGFQVFFKGMGNMFISVVSLLVCADIFAQGLKMIGAVNFIINSAQNSGFGVGMMTVVMAILVCVTAAITGSGVAAFFAFSKLAPSIAAKYGVSAASVILPMQLMAGMGRSISPVAGVIIAVSKAGECSPFMIVRRTIIPAIGGMITMLVLNWIIN